MQHPRTVYPATAPHQDHGAAEDEPCDAVGPGVGAEVGLRSAESVPVKQGEGGLVIPHGHV